MANLTHFHEVVTLVKADEIIPTVDGHSRKHFKQMRRPRVIKSHYPFDSNYRRVIYVIRDPRDVALSQYYFQIKRRVLEDGYPLERFVDRFIAGETCPYGSWGENAGSWLGARQNDPNFLLLRYEDMLRQTATELAKIAAFLGIAPSPDRLAAAIERSSADRMRKLEALESTKWDSTKNTRQDISFVRAAQAGEGKSRLPPECIDRIGVAWGGIMRAVGYDNEFRDNTGETNRSSLWESV